MKILKRGAFSDEELFNVDVKTAKVTDNNIIIECSNDIVIELSHMEGSQLIKPIKEKPLIALKIMNGADK